MFIPQNENLIPIYTDNCEGVNIADLLNYSELRAHYWVWKNAQPCEYVGFFHFRRYLDIYNFDIKNCSEKKLPYVYKKMPSENIDKQKIENILKNYDCLVPIKEYTGISVYSKYSAKKYQKLSDLKFVYEYIAKKYPEYKTSADEYLNGESEYYCNMFIFKWKIFEKYCEWIFDILNHFTENNNEILPRTQGYLAERLTGIFITKLIKDGYNVGALRRLDFTYYNDKNHSSKIKKVAYFLLPPSSKRRAFFAKLKYGKKCKI